MKLATATIHKNSAFAAGVIAGISIAVGYLPVALTFGLLAKSTGLTLLEAVAMSAFVFAGASQYIALNLLAIGTGSLEIIFTTFIVNLRHLLMSASLSEKVEEDHPLKKACYAFGITDEVFAVASTQDGQVRTSFIFGVALMAYGSWVANTVLGYMVGNFLPETIQQSMAIALYAMFIALLIPSIKKHKKIIVLVGCAAMLNSLFQLFLPVGWSIILATLLSAVLVELFDRKGDETCQ